MSKNAELRKHFNNWKKSCSGKMAVSIMKRRQWFMCPSCHADLDKGYHVHHLFPISKMDEDDYAYSIDHTNMILLCPTCNKRQSNKVDTRFD